MDSTQTAPARKSGLATFEQSSRYLSVSKNTLYRMIEDGELPDVKLRNSRRIPWSALHKLADGE